MRFRRKSILNNYITNDYTIRTYCKFGNSTKNGLAAHEDFRLKSSL